jgi:hypothetical protein
MSFYQVLAKRFPGKSQVQIAAATKTPVNTLRGWNYAQPTLERVVRVAESLGEDEMVLIQEAIEDIKREREATT